MTGLNMGADDYINKALPARELIARIRAALRKQERAGQAFEVCGLCVDTASGVVTKYGRGDFSFRAGIPPALIFMNNSQKYYHKEPAS